VALLEVVLALAMFVGFAFAILSGLSVCIRSAGALRQEAQAADLAVTTLSEIQMGLVSPADAGPTAFDPPADDWTWQIALVPGMPTGIEGADLSQVEIVIRNTGTGYAYRLYEMVPVATAEPTATAAASASAPAAEGTP
jgi:hypothetical protein